MDKSDRLKFRAIVHGGQAEVYIQSILLIQTADIRSESIYPWRVNYMELYRELDKRYYSLLLENYDIKIRKFTKKNYVAYRRIERFFKACANDKLNDVYLLKSINDDFLSDLIDFHNFIQKNY